MDEWVTTSDADKVKKVGHSQRNIGRLAGLGKIEAEKRGDRWWVRVTFSNGKWDLVYSKKTEQSKIVTEHPSQEGGKDTPLREHVDQVATAAKSLASNVERLFYYKSHGSTAFRGDIVKGFRSYWGSPEDSKVIEIEEYLARCVLAHYEDKYDRLPYEYWEDVTKENASQELTDNLVRLANTSVLEPCPICPACQEIAGLPHIGRNWIRYKDEKTGKWRYMPEDF